MIAASRDEHQTEGILTAEIERVEDRLQLAVILKSGEQACKGDGQARPGDRPIFG